MVRFFRFGMAKTVKKHKAMTIFWKRTLTVIGIMIPAIALVGQVRFGLKAGANLSTTYGNPEELNGEEIERVDFRPGFQVGLVTQYDISERFGITGELNYEQRNGKKNIEIERAIPTEAGDINIFTNVDAKNSFGYVNVPILFSYKINRVRLYAGPNFGYLVHASSDQERNVATIVPPPLDPNDFDLPPTGETNTEIDYINDDPYDDEGSFINRFDLGSNIGIAFQTRRNIFMDLRIYHSLLDVTEDDYDNSLITGESRDDNDLTVSIQLNFGWMF